jgi:hypothetical protein
MGNKKPADFSCAGDLLVNCVKTSVEHKPTAGMQVMMLVVVREHGPTEYSPAGRREA